MRSATLGSAMAVLLAASACGLGDQERSQDEITSAVLAAVIPESLATGEALYESNCAACHGNRGLGTASGPPLVHIIYEPAHHGDVAFIMAVQRGVRAHHWRFGDMQPIPNLTREDINQVTMYIRHLQRVAGID